MKIVHALDELPKSIFLAGPTPREPKPGRAHVPSWRPQAIEMLERIGFEGTVLVPEPNGKDWAENYDDQILWEWEGIGMATATVFWVPRDMQDMPALTTNVEYGLTVASSRILLGWPSAHTPSMGYLAALARRYRIPVRRDLEELLRAAVDFVADPFAHAREAR